MISAIIDNIDKIDNILGIKSTSTSTSEVQLQQTLRESPQQNRQWVNIVHQVEESIASGEVKLINAAATQFFSTKEAAEQFADSNYFLRPLTNMEVRVLEEGNSWWMNREEDKIFVRIKNGLQKPVSLILLDFFDGDCSFQEPRYHEYYLILFEKPVTPNVTAVITSKLKLKTIKESGCGNIINAW